MLYNIRLSILNAFKDISVSFSPRLIFAEVKTYVHSNDRIKI